MDEDILVHLGIKVTKQRKIIMEILEGAEQPLTADEIYDKVEDKDTINYSTVYRTLGTLSEKGAVTKAGEPGGKTYYQLKRHNHAHELECVECHKHITIEQCPLEAFSRMLSKETGFVITEHNLQIKGICPECAKHHK
nr:Fur family transcriptional regulator [uncultured Cellulosilyticum sp.]